MENTLEIVVTQEDIDQGKRGECSSCPIALAFSRLTGIEIFRVYQDSIRVYETKLGSDSFRENFEETPKLKYRLPFEANQFVYGYDRHGPSFVKPLTFVAEKAL